MNDPAGSGMGIPWDRGTDLKTWFDDAPLGIFQSLSTGRFRKLNLFMARVLGFETAKEAMEHYTDIGNQFYAHPQRRLDFFTALRERGQVENFEFEEKGKNGRSVWLSMNARIMEVTDDRTFVISGFLSDISERKRIEGALRQGEELQRKYLMAIPDLIVQTDLNNTILFVNEFTLGKFTDLSKNHFIGRNIFEFIGAEDLDRAQSNNSRMLKEELGPQEYRLKVDEDRSLDCEVNGEVLHDEAGKAVGVVYVIRDISERKKAQQALKESEERYKSFISQVSDAVLRFELIPPMPLSLDGESQIDYIYDKSRLAECNDTFLKMYHVSDKDQVLGQSLLFFHHGRDNPQNRRMMKKFIESGYRIQGMISEEPDSLGKLRFFSNNSLGIVEKGCLVRMWSTQTDITEQLGAEAEREKLQAQLLQAQKMESVGRLAGGVAHDFNNMLGVIQGYTDLSLIKIEPNHPVRGFLQQIRRAAERSSNLTRQLLAFARKQIVDPRLLDLNAVVEGMLSMLERLIGENIELIWRPGKDLLPVRIDPSQMDQILANLCVNSRDAINGHGHITIETEKIGRDFPRPPDFREFGKKSVAEEYVCLSISDDGCGMGQETQSHLFEPFFTTKEMGKGTGLGLATVYGIVKQNHGHIEVRSELGQGTRVEIYLPGQAGELKPDCKGKDERRVEAGQGVILLVEDEPAILEMTKVMLQEFGYHVLAAASPGQAIEIAKTSERIDLLVTDVVMPGMNGRDLAQAVVSFWPGLKCLFMSGYSSDVIAPHGVLRSGMTFIEKPFDIEALAAKIKEVLSG